MDNKSTEKSLLYQKGFSLTDAESEVLTLLTDEFLTPNQIKIRRNCSKQAVYKIIKSLKEKGAINSGLQRVDSIGGSSQPTHQRLHAQQFRIRIINKTQKYLDCLKRCNTFNLDSNSIRLYPDIVEIYSGNSFFGIDEQEATSKSMDYWKRFIVRLENELGAILMKDRVKNINIVKQHFAETNSQLAKESQKSGQIVKVEYHDGKLSVVMDNSFNLNERECIHPKLSKQHSEAISKQVKDFIEHNPPTNSEITINLNKASQIVLANQELLLGLPEVINDLRKQIRSHLALIKEYRKENRIWRKDIETKYISQSNNHQSKLGDFL